MTEALQTLITCPTCGTSHQETMPTNACIWFYECQSCHHVLRPKDGDCCVFCSYATARCPPAQRGECGYNRQNTVARIACPLCGSDDVIVLELEREHRAVRLRCLACQRETLSI